MWNNEWKKGEDYPLNKLFHYRNSLITNNK